MTELRFHPMTLVRGFLRPIDPQLMALLALKSITYALTAEARQFGDSVGVSGITLTKLDGTAKGGIIFAIAKQMQLPIRFIGVGEQIDDLRPFDAEEFVAALFSSDD